MTTPKSVNHSIFKSFAYLVVSLFVFNIHSAHSQSPSYDLVIYGGTSAGVAAAIQAARMGKSAILIEPSNHVGGLTTGGLGATDIGNKQAIGGISREFYQRIKDYYDKPENWKWQDRSDYFTRPNEGRSREGEDAMWTFEPSAAKIVYDEMLREADIKLITNQRLNRSSGVKVQGSRIQSITMESGETYNGKMFMDATYEGDLMAAAGVSYTYGREANSAYGETLNGVQANYFGITLRGEVSRNAVHHNFIPGVDPYIKKGDPSSGLLPFIIQGGPGIDGSADKGIQAYCFRMTLTDHPDNRIPFAKPANYRELDYELLFRNYEAATGPIEKMYHYGDPLVPWINTPMPNRKTDTNNQKGFSTDFIGQNHDYPEASYEEREAMAKQHLEYQQGLMWTLAYHPRIPKQVRDVVSKWGMAKDEFTEHEGWTPQLYVREARRMISDYVVTQKDCESLVPEVEDAVGLAAYGMDSHMVQRYVDHNGYVQNEGNFEAHVRAPYPIPYRAIVPKKGETENLFVPVCVSSTHVAFGSIRMEPVFMVLGQSAATAAVLAIDNDQAVQDVDYAVLRARLLQDKQVLSSKP
ncbi:putative xanthan lyase [Lunatimonas lonarensis]|uniref:Putative xanthan lyase n=1 Tax=Lunatimonas lonarensis TaxID=1232681 RepID=R7ZVA5_9BACT|nr:FAD-dependent oxidoreductase [Lunatimonas lonarensis]EON77963.1 putative xanthan lyase [Lunatimonas lonarensis]